MADQERLKVFLESFDQGNSEMLNRIEAFALATDVPVIRRSTQSALRMLLELKKPETILEVGTAIGFSALLFAENSNARITTIENYEKRIPLAKEHFHQAGMEDRITLMEGDAAEILPTLKGPFDLIFMDAAKGQYITFLPEIRRLMKSGSVLVSDNVSQDGDLLESHFAVERRNRTIHKRMREYLYVLTTDPEFVTTILSDGDGLAISVKR